MGRHHMKLPDHLYLSPPQTPLPNSSSSFTSFSSLKSATYHSAALLSETSSSALAVGDRIPGFKTSAAFFQSLRHNLSLPPLNTPTPSETSSYPDLSDCPGTPDSLRPGSINMTSSVSSLPPPSPSPLAQELEAPSNGQDAPSVDPLADVPDLTTFPVESEDDKIEGLRLVADSVAQQRQLASSAIIYHPLMLSCVVLIVAALFQYFYHGRTSDLAIMGTTGTGILMTLLISIRWAVSGYVDEAERVGTYKWLDLGRDEDGRIVGKEDDILVTKFGAETIAAVIFRGVRDGGADVTSSPKKGRRKESAKDTANVQCVIRAWTVKRRYRGKGVGTGILEEVVKIAKERGWGAGIVFDEQHANSKKILWTVFNAGFAKSEKRARRGLEKVLDRENEEASATAKEKRRKR